MRLSISVLVSLVAVTFIMLVILGGFSVPGLRAAPERILGNPLVLQNESKLNPSQIPLRPVPLPPGRLHVIIERVEGLDCFDETFPVGCTSDPDFFAEVQFDDDPSLSNEDVYIENKANIFPNWVFSKQVDSISSSVRVIIRMREKDLKFNDKVDLDPNRGSNDVDLTVNLSTCLITGDIVGSCGTTQTSRGGSGDDRNAEIRFRIEFTPLNTLTSCEVDLQSNTHTCAGLVDTGDITFIQEPSNSEVVFKVNMLNFTKAVFHVKYGVPPTDWTVNIGDSATNNGAGGDGGTQSNDAELDIQDRMMRVFGNDNNPENPNPLQSLSDFVKGNNYLVTLVVSNERLDWDNHNAEANALVSPFLYALNGQADSEGPVNYDIYAAFNRTIGSSGRNGTGVTHVTVILLPESTAIDLLSFTAHPAADHITLTWQTGTEVDNAGFNLYRATAAAGPYTRLNDTLIPAQGDPVSGASYAYTDSDVVKGVTYYYKLEDVDIHGVSTFHGPVVATTGAIRSIYLPVIMK